MHHDRSARDQVGIRRAELSTAPQQLLETLAYTTSPLSEEASTERVDQRGLKFAYAALLLVAVGRVGELIPGLGSLPLAKVAGGVALVLLISRWKGLQPLSPAAAPFIRTIVGLVVLAAVLAPIGIWPGKSIGFLYKQLPVMAVSVVTCWKVAHDWNALRGIIRVLVVSGLALAATAVLGFGGGRASAGESLDTNDLAYVLVSLAPLALAFALTARTRVKRLVNAGVCALMVVAALLTSSRGGFFGLIAVVATLIVLPIKRPEAREGEGRSRNRIVLPALGVVCASMLLWPYLPAATRDRLGSVLQLGNDYNMDPTNKNGRSAIWDRGLQAAQQRPIGYGILSYPMVDVKMGGQFRAPHNSYLEVLVELGVVGLLLFLRMYWLCWRALQGVRHSLLAAVPSNEHDEIIIFARMLQVALVGNAVAGFFLSMSYANLLWVLFAVVITCVSLVSAAPPATAPVALSDTDS